MMEAGVRSHTPAPESFNVKTMSYRNGVADPLVSGLIRTCLPTLGTPRVSTTYSM
jgi:hypothetical protein